MFWALEKHLLRIALSAGLSITLWTLGCEEEDTVAPLVVPAEEVDTFWGDAPSADERLSVFDDIWSNIGEKHAAFVTTDVDWDWVYEEYRPRIEAAQGRGRYFQLFSEMFTLLQDAHTTISDDAVCDTAIAKRPPFFQTNCS